MAVQRFAAVAGEGNEMRRREDEVFLGDRYLEFAARRHSGNLLGRTRLACRQPPHLIRQPFQPLLGIVEFRRRHGLGAPSDFPRMAEEFVQDLPQRPIVAALRDTRHRGSGLLAAGAHAVWIPEARSSACRSSSTAARTVDGAPCSAKLFSTWRRPGLSPAGLGSTFAAMSRAAGTLPPAR